MRESLIKGLCDQLKLLRARFLRLIVFHDGFLDLLSGMDSDGQFPVDDPLFFIFNDIDYLLNTFKGDTNALNYHFGTLMKLQSGIDADSRYDEKRAKLAKLFLPVVKVRGRQRYGNTKYRCAVYRFYGTVLRYGITVQNFRICGKRYLYGF